MAAEVRALMARHRKNQADVSRHLGIKPNAVSFRWQGKTPWTLSELLLLCDWLDVDAAEVMARAKAAALEESSAAKRALESILTEQERADIEAKRKQLRPKKQQPGGHEQENGREAQ